MASCFFLAWALRHQIRFNWICFVTVWNVFFCCSRTGMMQNFETDKNHVYIYIYLDLPYGTYFCRCSETLELSPFLRQNPVPENKCHCEILWEIVSPRSRVFLPFGGAFSPLKNWFGSYIIYIYWYISEQTLVCPKRSFLCKTMQNLFIGQKAAIKPTLEEAGWGRYMYKDYVPGPAGGFQSRCKFMLSDVSTGGYQSAPIQCNSLVQKLLILCLVALIFLLTKILQTRLVKHKPT